MPTQLSYAEGNKAMAVIGKAVVLLGGVGDLMHVETFNVRNLGDPGSGLSFELEERIRCE